MTLKLAVRDQAAFEHAFDAQIAAFEASNPDIRVERHSFTIEDQYGKFIDDGGALDGEFDLYLGVTDWLPEAVAKNLFVNLDPYLEKDPPQDWPQGWSKAMLGLPSASGHFYAVPWHDGPEVFHYRADLFEDPMVRRVFKNRFGRELTLPLDWKEFLDVAHFFTDPTQDFWGCCVAAAPDGHNNVYDFLIHLWSRGGELLDPLGAPAFNNNPGWRALEYYSALINRFNVASPDCLELNSVQSGDYYAAGNAAMMWNWCGFAATTEMPESQIKGMNRCAPIPGGVSLNIFWALSILAGSKNPDAAYAFLKHVCSPAMDRLTTLNGANGVRLSTWRDPDIQSRFPYYGMLEEVHQTTRTLPAIPEYPAINEVLNQAVKRVTHDRMNARESLSIATQALLPHK